MLLDQKEALPLLRRQRAGYLLAREPDRLFPARQGEQDQGAIVAGDQDAAKIRGCGGRTCVRGVRCQ